MKNYKDTIEKLERYGQNLIVKIMEIMTEDEKDRLSEQVKNLDLDSIEHLYNELTKKEVKILSYLMNHQGQIVSRDLLMEYLWSTDYFVDDSTLTVNITRLRKKLEEIGIENVIETRRGLGYIMP